MDKWFLFFSTFLFFLFTSAGKKPGVEVKNVPVHPRVAFETKYPEVLARWYKSDTPQGWIAVIKSKPVTHVGFDLGGKWLWERKKINKSSLSEEIIQGLKTTHPSAKIKEVWRHRDPTFEDMFWILIQEKDKQTGILMHPQGVILTP